MAGLTPENRAAYIRMGYEVDQASISAAVAANTKIESSLNAVEKSATSISTSVDRAGKTIKDVFSYSEASIQANAKALADLRQDFISTADEAAKLTQAQTKMSSPGIGVEGLRRTGGALRQLGLEGPGEAVSKVGDIAEVGKELKALGDAAKGLPGVLGNVAASGAAAAAPLGATAASIGAVAIVAAPVALAIADVAIGMELLKRNADRATEAEKQRYEEEVQQIEKQDELRKKSRSMTAEQNAQDTNDLIKTRADYQKQLDDLKARKAANEAAYTALGSSINPGERSRLGATGQQLDKEIQTTLEKMDALNKQFVDNTKTLDPLIQKQQAERKTAQDLITAANAKTAADQLQLQTLEKIRTATEGKVATTQKEQAAIEQNVKAAAKVVDDTIAQKKAEIAANQELITNLEKLGPDNTAATAEIARLRAENEKLTAQTDQLVKVTKPLVEQREKEALAASKSAFDAQKAVSDLFEKIKKSAEETKQKAEEAGKALQKGVQDALEADKRVAAVQQKFNENRAQIEERDATARLDAYTKYESAVDGIERKSLEARADLQTKYADELVNIARNAADEANKLLADLEQKQADLRTTLVRDEDKAGREATDQALTLQIKAQRAERDALQEHLQRLKEIRKGDYAADQKDLLDRNFASIYLRRLAQTQQMEGENTRFIQDREKRSQTNQDESQDAQRAAQIARRERLIAFQQQLVDAQNAFSRERAQLEANKQRELQAAQIAHERELQQQRIAKDRQLKEASLAYANELNALTAKLSREQAALQRSYTEEVRIASLYGQKRVEEERRTQERLLAQARSAQSVATVIRRPEGHGVTERAFGGSLETGQLAMVNEPGSSGQESFNGIPLPGAGLFMPMQAGYVSPNGGGGGNTTISVPVTVNGATDPATTARIVQEQVVYVVKRVMGK